MTVNNVIETLFSDTARAKLESLEEESRQLNVQLVELSRTATDYTNMIQKKEADIGRLTSELAASKKDKDTSAEQVIKLENDLEVLIGEYEAQKVDKERDAQARSGLQRELDDLRKKMAAKASEDSKILRDIEKSKEQELASLRSQAKKFQDELADVRRQSSEAQNKLKLELEAAQRRLKELESSHRDLTVEHTSSEEKKKELEASLAETAKTKRIAETELQQVRTRQIDLDSQMEEAVHEKEVKFSPYKK
jgi:myosin protein heavy chain